MSFKAAVQSNLWQRSFTFYFFYQFFLEQSCFTMLHQFLLYSKVSQLYVYIYPLFGGFPSHLGHHRALSRVPCAIQQVLISYLFYTQQGMYVNPNLMDLEIVIQSEGSQKEKNKYCIIPHICGIQKNGTEELICKAEIETQMQRTNLWTPRGEVGR